MHVMLQSARGWLFARAWAQSSTIQSFDCLDSCSSAEVECLCLLCWFVCHSDLAAHQYIHNNVTYP